SLPFHSLHHWPAPCALNRPSFCNHRCKTWHRLCGQRTAVCNSDNDVCAAVQLPFASGIAGLRLNHEVPLVGSFFTDQASKKLFCARRHRCTFLTSHSPKNVPPVLKNFSK